MKTINSSKSKRLHGGVRGEPCGIATAAAEPGEGTASGLGGLPSRARNPAVSQAPLPLMCRQGLTGQLPARNPFLTAPVPSQVHIAEGLCTCGTGGVILVTRLRRDFSGRKEEMSVWCLLGVPHSLTQGASSTQRVSAWISHLNHRSCGVRPAIS